MTQSIYPVSILVLPLGYFLIIMISILVDYILSEDIAAKGAISACSGLMIGYGTALLTAPDTGVLQALAFGIIGLSYYIGQSVSDSGISMSEEGLLKLAYLAWIVLILATIDNSAVEVLLLLALSSIPAVIIGKNI